MCVRVDGYLLVGLVRYLLGWRVCSSACFRDWCILGSGLVVVVMLLPSLLMTFVMSQHHTYKVEKTEVANESSFGASRVLHFDLIVAGSAV